MVFKRLKRNCQSVHFYYRPPTKFAKVMFSQVSVHRVGCLPHTPTGRHPLGRHLPLGRQPPLGRPPLGRHPRSQRRGHQPIIWSNFPKGCMKMKEIRPRGDTRPFAPSLRFNAIGSITFTFYKCSAWPTINEEVN